MAISALPTMPILIALMGMSSRMARACSTMISEGIGENDMTSTVSCTVAAVIMEAATQPWLLMVSMSACMPAPPVGSAPEKHNTTGGVMLVICFVTVYMFCDY